MNIPEKDILDIINRWNNLEETHNLTTKEKNILSQCRQDLQEVIDSYYAISDYFNQLETKYSREEIQQYLDEMEADNYLSTIEAHSNCA